MRSALLLSAAVALLAACGDDGGTSRACNTSDECVQGGVHGTCRPSPSASKSWCSYEDSACPAPPAERWGAAAGDGLAGTCVNMETVDAGTPDVATFDAGPDAEVPAMSSKIMVASQNEDKLYVYSADSLAPLATVPLPDRTGVGSAVIATASGYVWIASEADVTALDATSLTVLSGFPKHFDSDACNLRRGFFNSAGMYCGTATEFQMWSGLPPNLTGHVSIAGAWTPGGSDTRILVPHGSFYRTVSVLDATLAPVAGSPITASTSQSVRSVGASDALNRLVVVGGNGVDKGDVQLFDRTTLTSVKSISYPKPVSAVAFDDAHSRLIVSFNDGGIQALSALDGSVEVAEVSRSSTVINFLVVDANRGRLYALSLSNLIVLDVATLDHVAGSPVAVPAVGVGVAYY